MLGNWVDASEEFIERLACDWQTLRSGIVLNPEDDLLVGFAALGDAHCAGRRVAVCSFRSGFRLVYKPRPVRNELNFQKLLSWFNDRTTTPRFRMLTVIDRESYGWVEFAEAVHCTSADDLRRFYQRQGAYIAILHILAAQDFHYENVIASGEHPLMVDLESILQPALASDAQHLAPAERVVFSELWSDSVLRIGLLPSRTLARGDHDLDLSGLGAISGQPTPMRVPRWTNEGTDEMHQVLSEANLGEVHSSPIAPKAEIGVVAFAEEIVEGFACAYDVLYRSRDDLLSAGGPIAGFAREETRRILRPTMAYAMMLQSSLHPHFLTDGLSRDLHFDRLLGSVPLSGRRLLAEVAMAEREDLWRFDIPRFTTRPDSRDLWTSSSKRIPDFLPETGLDAVRRRLKRMSPDERDLQSWMIHTSIATASFTPEHGHRDPTSYRRPRPGIKTGGDALAGAIEIGEHLARLAIVDDGTAMWIGLTSQRGDRWGISPVGPELYEGIAGIAMFFAHLGLLSAEKRFVEVARAAVRTLRIQVARGALDGSIGGFSGLGGYVYALAQLAVPLDDADLIAEAGSAVSTIARLVDEDEGLDVIAGSAGCIVALLALYGIRPADETLSVAAQCGDRLLASAVETTDGLAWQREEISPRPLGGFSHGTAGIAWALLELFGATDEDRFRKAAVDAIRYDRSLFSAHARNWLDLRENVRGRLTVPTDAGRCLAHWCHGAAGIGLARIRCQRHWDDGLVREEIEAAVNATIRHGFGLSHCLCHGDLGNLELLTEAHRDLPDPRLEAEIRRLSGNALDSIEQYGCISGHILGIESPGLMMGSAGIGYGLLRLVAPKKVPSVLLLDPPVG